MRTPREAPATGPANHDGSRGANSMQSTDEHSFDRRTGVLRRYDDMLGFGLITPDDGGPDVFAHIGEIVANAQDQSLAKGQRVSYGLDSGPEGLQARRVMPLT